MLDGKFFGELFRQDTGAPVPIEQAVIFMAYDDCLPETLEDYQDECATAGCSAEHIAAVRALIDRVTAWRMANPQLCRRPGDRGQPDGTAPLGIPEQFKTAVADWLCINQKKANELRHGVFPLGFVQNLMERVATAEAKAGIRNNGVTARTFRNLPDGE